MRTPAQLTAPMHDDLRQNHGKIKSKITPRHHDPTVINFSVAAAPSALIVALAAAMALAGGGAWC